ncbi:hypothetical protein [Phycicoccus sp. Soil802]|uniref:hypothetical protein n=1 Tax=Phycicoccus sp. Soil802 TaxID=1736414 RepID=UPI000A7F2670|nr:hypothetical protein [Phycicoccus sp. Soil802]
MLSFKNVVGIGTEAGIEGNVGASRTRTVHAMPTTRRRLDQRRLLPRDYLLDPHHFGRADDPKWVLPEGGDLVSQRVAEVQHHIAKEVGGRRSPGLARVVTARFEFSKQYWSACLLGKAWMGETVLAAAVFAEWTTRPLRGSPAANT